MEVINISAANRGAVRQEADFYATPIECVDSILNALPEFNEDIFILEPSAGNGNIIKALRKHGITGIAIEAIKLREEEKENLENLADYVTIGDFLKVDTEYYEYDLIIGNPPYSKAQEFIDKSLSLLAPGGMLVFLLRTNFLESTKRFKWWQDKIPPGLYTLHKRPSFTGKGTDATSYSWFVWRKGQTDRQYGLFEGGASL